MKITCFGLVSRRLSCNAFPTTRTAPELTLKAFSTQKKKCFINCDRNVYSHEVHLLTAQYAHPSYESHDDSCPDIQGNYQYGIYFPSKTKSELVNLMMLFTNYKCRRGDKIK